MLQAVADVAHLGASNMAQATKQQELGLNEMCITAASAQGVAAQTLLEKQWTMMTAVLGMVPPVKIELSFACKTLAAVATFVANSNLMIAKLLRVVYTWWYPGKELSFKETMSLLQLQLQGYSAMTQEYQNSCEYLSRVLKASKQGTASSSRGSSPQMVDTAEAFLVQQLKHMGMIRQDGSVDEAAIGKVLEKGASIENRWVDPNSHRLLTIGSMQDVAWQMAATANMLRARRRLEHFCFVGLVGPQNAGKSTLVHGLSGVKPDPGDIGYDVHTLVARPFLMTEPDKQDSMMLMEFPGMNAVEKEESAISTALGGDVFAWLFVTSWCGDFDGDVLKKVALVPSYGHPTLICVNKARLYQKALANNMDVTRFLNNWKDQISKFCAAQPHGVPTTPYEVIMTDFEAPSTSDLDINVVQYVKNWILKLARNSGYEI
ncbi:hypothetical protein WJX77_005974 [Trebouxia sp. C0004]